MINCPVDLLTKFATTLFRHKLEEWHEISKNDLPVNCYTLSSVACGPPMNMRGVLHAV